MLAPRHIIDTHAHVLDVAFGANGLSTSHIMADAAAAGVQQIIGIAAQRPYWAPYLAWAAAHAGMGVAVGIHPCHAHEETEITLDELLGLSQNPHVVALGETGLDYYHTGTQHKDVQLRSFHTHAQAALHTGLPLVVHTRNAEDDTLAVLAQHPGVNFVLHCFTASAAMAHAAVAMGGYISFSGVATFKKSTELREIAASIPPERILIETDAPYLAPEPVRGKLCTPAHVAHTCACLAPARGLSTADFAALTTANAYALFGRLEKNLTFA